MSSVLTLVTIKSHALPDIGETSRVNLVYSRSSHYAQNPCVIKIVRCKLYIVDLLCHWVGQPLRYHAHLVTSIYFVNKHAPVQRGGGVRTAHLSLKNRMFYMSPLELTIRPPSPGKSWTPPPRTLEANSFP